MAIWEATAESIARRHIEFIKSRGEKGRSVAADLIVFEEMGKSNESALRKLRTEYSLIETLARVMKEEIEKMEEKN